MMQRGDLVEFQSLGRDFTRERQALLDLKDSEERFRTFMSQLPAVAFIKDANSRVLYTNTYMNEMLGSEDWIGQITPSELPREVVEKILEDDRRVIRGGRPIVIEEAFPVKTGQIRFFETRKFPRGEGRQARSPRGDLVGHHGKEARRGSPPGKRGALPDAGGGLP